MIDVLKDYLVKYGWRFREVETNALLTGFDNEEGFFYPLTISVKEDLVTLMCTFEMITEDLTSSTEKLLLMLRFNFAWPLVKIGLDEDFTMALTIDLPRYGLTFEAFEVSLELFTEMAQMLSLEFSDLIKPANE